MKTKSRSTYPPLHTLKRVCEDVWIVDGPIIRFGMLWPKMPFPTRMTIVRLDNDALFVHSPTPLTPALQTQIQAIGKPQWIIGPNRIHYWWIAEWKAAFEHAQVYLAPLIEQQAVDSIHFSFRKLESETAYPWDTAIATLPITGSFMTEVEFFHRASRTLILTDLIENFEPRKLNSLFMHCLTRLGGVQDPDGQMPRDMRLSFRRQKPQLKAAVEKMIGWNPARIILAHGRWYKQEGAAELRRAFRWLLK